MPVVGGGDGPLDAGDEFIMGHGADAGFQIRQPIIELGAGQRRQALLAATEFSGEIGQILPPFGFG